MFQNIATRVRTAEVTLSYVHLLEPYARPGDTNPAKYSVALLLPKSDTACKADIDAAIQAAIQDGIQKQWGGVKIPNPPVPVHDGDLPRENGTPRGDECKGHWIISARTDRKPEIKQFRNTGAGRELVDVPVQEVYSGMRGIVTINFFAYNFQGMKCGIGCGLGNVLKTADGEPLAGGTTAEVDFGDVQEMPAVAVANPHYANVYGGGVSQVINPLTGRPY